MSSSTSSPTTSTTWPEPRSTFPSYMRGCPRQRKSQAVPITVPAEACPAGQSGAHEMSSASSDIAFTPAVKAVQARRGSRGAYAKVEAQGGFRTAITPDLVAFLAQVDTAYLATTSAAGQPYAQHRGGPKGFIRALDERTLAFADYSG